MEKLNYLEDCKIDETALDVECLQQAELAMKYGLHWAECLNTLLLSEENVKLVRSDLIKRINKNPEKYSDGKTTGPAVEAAYRNHKDHIAAKEEWVQATYEANIATIAKSAIMVTRKEELENLIRLHGQQYFAGPTIPRDLSAEVSYKLKKDKELSANIAGKKRSRNN